jgi:ABC-type antimicrobial peptide transport system permease subunit
VERIAKGDPPDEFGRLDQVRLLPWLLAGFLGLIAVTATTALLVTAVKRRRRDMAVLRAAGLEGRGVRAIVVAQAVTVSIMGLIVGVPVGIILGRTVWRVVTEDLGVGMHLVVPVLPILAMVVTVLLVDVAVSLLPARRATRTSPATSLRAE